MRPAKPDAFFYILANAAILAVVVAERPYCRGRAYQADHYGKRGAQKEASSGENEE